MRGSRSMAQESLNTELTLHQNSSKTLDPHMIIVLIKYPVENVVLTSDDRHPTKILFGKCVPYRIAWCPFYEKIEY